MYIEELKKSLDYLENVKKESVELLNYAFEEN
jgi:hypothetical protein